MPRLQDKEIMDYTMKDYLQKCTPAQIDKTVLNALLREMERASLEAVKAVHDREELAAEIRHKGDYLHQ